MPWLDFVWTDSALEKIEARRITQEDVESVIMTAKATKSRSADRLVAQGLTENGRYLVCVYEMIDDITVIPVTAYEPTKGER